MSEGSSQDELSTGSTTNTQTFLETCVIDADVKALEEHLVNNPVQQSDLDKCLLRGLQIVQRKESELSHVAPGLTLLLQSGAKWNSEALLEEQKTPYHIICESPGDHHELLDLMIKSSQQTIIDVQDIDKYTALLYAVENANINCVRCLIANRADVTLESDRKVGKEKLLNPIMKAIWLLGFFSKHSSVIMSNIFDLLFDAAVDRNKDYFKNCKGSITCAVMVRNVHCIKILVKKGAPLDIIARNEDYVWELITRIGNLELLKCMFNRGIAKDSIDHNGWSILWWVVTRGNVEAVRYLLDIGVSIPNYAPKVHETLCEKCKEKRLIIHVAWKHLDRDPCVRAIRRNNLEIVKLLDEYGSQTCKSFTALRWSIKSNSVDVTSYLLNKYTYPLNMEYSTVLCDISSTVVDDYQSDIYTLLTEPRCKYNTQIIKLLLDYGADPAKPMCVNAMMTAIDNRQLDGIALYIRSGFDINFRSYDRLHKHILPFEASVLRGYHDVAKMLLIFGCSCGVFSLNNNHKFKDNLKPEVEKLMKEWKVQENNVIPLQQRCRCVILNHLYPRADKKIMKLPLPRLLIQFLCISEIDDIVDLYKEANRY